MALLGATTEARCRRLIDQSEPTTPSWLPKPLASPCLVWPVEMLCHCQCFANRFPRPASCRLSRWYATDVAGLTASLTRARVAWRDGMPLALLAKPRASPCLVSPVEIVCHSQCLPNRLLHHCHHANRLLLRSVCSCDTCWQTRSFCAHSRPTT